MSAATTRRTPRMISATPGTLARADEAARRYRAWRVAADACQTARGIAPDGLAPMPLLHEEERLYQQYTDACATLFHFVAGALGVDLTAPEGA